MLQINKLSSILLIVIAVLIAVIIITSNNSNEIDKYAAQKIKIDSLSKIINVLEQDQLKYDNTIAIYRDSLSLMDSQIDSTKNKIKKIQNDYGKKIKVISSANHDELGDFFTNRYK